MKKRLLSTVLVFSMLLSVFPMNVIAVEDKTAENAERIATNGLPELEFAEGLPYAGFTTQEGKLPEKGLYSLTVNRTGDTNIGSDLVVSTVDISAVYGKDYVIEDNRFVTELVETDGTILEQAADEESRKNAQEELEEIRDQIIGSTAEVDENADTAEPIVDADGDGELSLAEMKALQSGKNVRDLTESDFHSLKDKFLSQMNIDIADYVAISSQTRISFLPNETTKTLTFRVLEDNESEGEEIFNFLLSAEDTNTAIIEANTSVSFIIEDDEPIEHSVVTLAADSFTAKNGVVKVKVSREAAEYSYVTAGLKVTGSESGLAEKQEYTAVFQPYQTEAYVEIPVTQDSKEHSFTVELYDLKGGDEGNTLTAQVKIPAVAETVKTNNEESPDSYLDDFTSQSNAGLLSGDGTDEITIAGVKCEVKYDDPDHSNYGSIMMNGSKIGIYVVPNSMGMFSGTTSDGDGDHIQEIKNDGNSYLYLEYYSSWYRNLGKSGKSWNLDYPNRYRAVMTDVSTDSTYDSAKTGLAVKRIGTLAESGIQLPTFVLGLIDINSPVLIGVTEKTVGNRNSRAVRLGSAMFKKDGDNYVPYNFDKQVTISPYVERAEVGLQRPNSNFYGFILLYREFKVKFQQPDKLSYRSGELNADGTPKMVSLSPAAVSAVTSETRYSGESIQLNEYPAGGNNNIYGELKGYNITPLEGTTFFYETNSKNLVLDDELIKLIDQNTTKLQKGAKLDTGDYLAYTTITIKPVYDYKNVSMTILQPKGLDEGVEYHYLDKDLENMRKNGTKTTTNIFHVGDKMNLTITTPNQGYNFTGYSQFQYLNPGDTAYDKNVPHTDNYVAGTIPGWNIVHQKCEVRGIFGRQNYISIEMDSQAEKYFTIRNLVPQNELTLSYMKGQNVLAISNENGGTNNKTLPVVSRAYTIELDPTAENNGQWRPVITFSGTNQKVNGFAADFIARDNYEDNIVKISAERYDPSWYEYFSVDGMAYYSAYSLRANSDAVSHSPTMQAIVTAGGSVSQIYTGSGSNKKLTYSATRYITTTDNNGKYSLNGIRAMEGDIISIVVDNNDMQQVKYVTLTKPTSRALRENPEKFVRTSTFDELTADTVNQTNVNKRVTAQCSIVNASDIDMPIRTFYSPYVNSVYFAYKKNFADPQHNQIPIYDSDELMLSVNVVTNGADVRKVNIKKIARNGTETNYEGILDTEQSSAYDKQYSVTVSGEDMAALDRFYVQITAVPKGGTKEITYTALDTGLTLYVPKEEKPTQFLNYELPTPYDDLPILGDMAGDLDSGKLSWKTIYADENNKGTSPYAEIVTLSVSKKDIEEKSEKLKSLGGPEDKKSWDTMLKDKESDVYSYLNQSTQDSLYNTYKESHPNATKDEYKNHFNSNPNLKKEYQNEFKKNAKKDALSELGETEIDVTVSVLVQLEYNYNPEKRTHYYSGGQYLISAAVSVEKTFYWTVFGIPVYLNIQGEASLQFDGRYVTDEEETTAQEMGYYENLTEKVESEYPYIELGLGITLQPGIGICGVLGVRGILKFAFVGRMNTDPEDFGGKGGTMGTFTGGVGVDLLVFSFEYEIGSIGWKTGVFDDDNLQAGMPSEESFSIRAFNNGTEYKNENLRSTLLPDAKTTLINGAMEYIRPQLIDLGDGRTMLLFLRNMSSADRDESNASTLVYAVRSADGTWDRDNNNNISSIVVENDNMADSTFAAMKSGDKVYIAWTNANVKANFENNIDSAKEILQSSDIHMAVFDIATETMGKPFEVTSDNFVNSDVILAQEENNIALYYFKKDISTSEKITDLVGLSNNYNTWARKVYDPVKKQFIAVAAGKNNPEEELIVIEHPLINDPMVTDLSAADYTYKNKNYRFYSYTIDRDGDLETADDRELWVRVTNLTDNRNYYPIPIDASKDNVLSPKLTKIEDDVYLTWLSNSCIYNAVSANTMFKGLDEVKGTGDYAETSGLDMVRALTAEQIAKNGWYKLPYDSLENASYEEHGALYNLAHSVVENNKKEFGELNTEDKYEGTTLNDHQLVAGGDGNLYLFWTKQPNIDVENDTGRELYGAALYRGESADSNEYSGWSDAVQLTNYGKVIDELTVSVGSDKGAILVGNLYSQEIGYDGKVVYDDHELAEIDFIPGNSLEFTFEEIVLSDYYPVEGEKVGASFGITNNGLLPAEKYNLTINGETATINDNVIYPAQRSENYAEFVAGKDGELTVSAEVRELGEVQELAVKDSQSNKVEVSTKKGAVLEFGKPAIYSIEDVSKYFNKDNIDFDMANTSEEYINETIQKVFDVSSSTDERLKAVIADCVRSTIVNQDNSSYYACIPVTNVGNLEGKDLKIYATIPAGSTDEITEDEMAGFKNVSLIPVKQVDSNGNAITETVYAVIWINPKTTEIPFDNLGILHLNFKFELDGEELEETAVAERQFLENQKLVIENSYNYTITSGESFQIETTAYPWNELKELVYEVYPFDDNESNPVVVTSDGLVTGICEGTSMILVTDISSSKNVSNVLLVDVVVPEPCTVMLIDKLSGRPSMIQVEYGEIISDLPIPTKDGWTFNGWYTDNKYTTLFDSNTPITEDITLYAHWTEQEVVTFYDEFAGRPNKVSVEHGTVISDPPMPTYDGWIFDGWYIDEEYTTLFDWNTPITQNIKLYAKWTKEPSELVNLSTISSNEIVLGDTITVNAAAVGGNGDYTYAVYYKKTSDTNWTTKQKFTDNAEVVIRPALATMYDICVKVRDSSGTIAKKYFNATVMGEKLQNTSEISAVGIILGDTVTINASAIGGMGDYKYGVFYKKASDTQWICKQNFTKNTQVTIEPETIDVYDICIKVKDKLGGIDKLYFKLTVNDQLSNTSTISATTISKGNIVTLYGSALGGVGNYTYAVLYKKAYEKKWTVRQDYDENAEIIVKPYTNTDYDICIKVKDEMGTISKKYFKVTVNDKLSNTSTISAETISKGDTVTLNGSAAGGVGNYTYAVLYKKKSEQKWTVRQDYNENAEIIVRPYANTDYDICIKVKDEMGTIAKKFFEVSVK